MEAAPGTWEWVFQQMHKRRNPTGWRRDMYGKDRIVRAIEVITEEGEPLMCIPDYLAAPYSPVEILYAYQDARFWQGGILERHQYKHIAIAIRR